MPPYDIRYAQSNEECVKLKHKAASVHAAKADMRYSYGTRREGVKGKGKRKGMPYCAKRPILSPHFVARKWAARYVYRNALAE